MRRYAFGTATQVLPVPELMPFRLTRQLAGALAPYDATAVLHRPMAAALSALRDGGAILHVRPRALPLPPPEAPDCVPSNAGLKWHLLVPQYSRCTVITEKS